MCLCCLVFYKDGVADDQVCNAINSGVVYRTVGSCCKACSSTSHICLWTRFIGGRKIASRCNSYVICVTREQSVKKLRSLCCACSYSCLIAEILWKDDSPLKSRSNAAPTNNKRLTYSGAVNLHILDEECKYRVSISAHLQGIWTVKQRISTLCLKSIKEWV